MFVNTESPRRRDVWHGDGIAALFLNIAAHEGGCFPAGVGRFVPAKELSVPIGYESGSAREVVWMRW